MLHLWDVQSDKRSAKNHKFVKSWNLCAVLAESFSSHGCWVAVEPLCSSWLSCANRWNHSATGSALLCRQVSTTSVQYCLGPSEHLEGSPKFGHILCAVCSIWVTVDMCQIWFNFFWVEVGRGIWWPLNVLGADMWRQLIVSTGVPNRFKFGVSLRSADISVDKLSF
jgi:hypothetical protein